MSTGQAVMLQFKIKFRRNAVAHDQIGRCIEKLTGFKSGNFGLHFGLFEKRPSGLILESNKARLTSALHLGCS